jgi:hypothetical protein
LPIPILIEHVVTFVIVVLVTVMVLTFAFVAGAIGRRRRRDRYSKSWTSCGSRWCRWSPASSRKQSTPPKLAALRELSAKSDAAMFEQLVVERLPPPDKLPALAKLCEDPGSSALASAPGDFPKHAASRACLCASSASGIWSGRGRRRTWWPSGTAAVGRCW